MVHKVSKFVVFAIYNDTSEYNSDYAKKTYIVNIKLIWQVNWTILGINIDNIGVPAISKHDSRQLLYEVLLYDVVSGSVITIIHKCNEYVNFLILS